MSTIETARTVEDDRYTSLPARHSAPASVTFISTALRQGGAEHQVTLLATGLAGRGWRVSVVSMRPPEAHVGTLEAAGVEVVSLGMPRTIPHPRGLLLLARHIRARRPDVVHSHMVHANLLARATRAVAPMPVLISTAHNVSEGPRWRELAYRLTDPLTDLTTNVSHAAVRRYVRVGAVPRRKIRHLPNGIDLRRFSPDLRERSRLRSELGVEDASVLLAVGRLEPAKDQATLLAALQQVTRAHPEAVLLLVGTGSLEASLRAQAASLGLESDVRFLGERADVPGLMSAADLYVMSSRWEGLPLVLLEAAAVELPIVATAVGGNHEIVSHEVSGLLVPPAQPGALARAIGRVLALTPAERADWGAAGRSLVEREYGIGRILDLWEATYEELWQRTHAARVRGAPTG